MDREIKFRAWDKVRKRFTKNFIIEPDGTLWSGGLSIRLRLEQCVLIEYTGLKDKNDTPIYEGDIVRFVDDAEGHLELTGQVYWDERACGFAEKGTHEHDAGLSPFCDDYEVIGNIWEHPHLLEEKS